MPLQKYYCDYCDKQFQDTHSARKRHLQSLHHLRARSLWFDSLRLSSVLNQAPAADADADAFPRGVCNRFVKTGFCHYGDSCKYVHPKGVANFGTSSGAIAPGNVVPSSARMAWDNLPPSLRPPPPGAYGAQSFVDWG